MALESSSDVPVFEGKADIHIHSASGDALPTPEEIIEHVEHNTDLDVVAITDHDELEGAFQARELAAKKGYRVQVIVGCEITTLDGHLLALDIESPVRMLQSVEKTIEAVHRQGGICIVPHPMSWLTLSVGHKVLLRVASSKSPTIYFDGFEVFNPSIAGRVAHERARNFNRSVLHLPEVGGSDAHHLHLIGTAYTLFEGKTSDDFRRSLALGRTSAHGEFWQPNAQFEGFAALQLKSLVVHPTQKIRKAIESVWGGRHA